MYSCSFEIENNNTQYDIIIIAGQSNTNQGIGLDTEIDVPDDNIFQLGRYSIYNHVITPANEPLQHHTSDTQKIGFGLTFSKLYNEYENINNNPLLIIPCGFGGSSLIKNWNFDGFLYTDMIERVKFITKKYPNSKVKVLLWHQGESDISSSNYSEHLQEFILKTRTDLNSDHPFILGGMVPFWTKKHESRIKQQNIIKNIPNIVDNTAYADPEIPFVIRKQDDTFDEVHYDAKGQRELGKRYFTAYQNLMK